MATRKTTKKKKTVRKTRSKAKQNQLEDRDPEEVELESAFERVGFPHFSHRGQDTDAGVWVKTMPRTSGKIKPQPRGFWKRDELWMFCLRCLQHRVRKFEVKRLLREFIISLGYEGKISISNFEVTLAKARAELRAESELSKEDHVAQAYETMLQIINDPKSEYADVIKAQQVLNDLLGLSAKYQQGGQTAEEKVKKIKELLDEEDPGHDSG